MARRQTSVFVALALLVGCGGESDPGIKTYRVVKPTDSPAAPAPQAPGGPAPTAPPDTGTGPYRILGGMFPSDNPQWFFKLAGPADEVAKVEKDVDAFLASMKFGGGAEQQPTWDVPAGWKVGTPRKSMFPPFATLLVGEKGMELNATRAGGGLEMNLTRWAGQVGADADKAKTTRELTTASGVKGLRVDLTGPKNPGGSMGMGR